jgi:predicted esterase
MEYTNVVIWLNDYNSGSEISANPFINDEFYSKDTRLVFPESPRRKMNYKVLGGTPNDLAWFNMNQNYGNFFQNGVGFNNNEKLFNQQDIMEECEVVLKIINEEIDLLKDKDSKRIFLGGLSMGADMALALYLRSNKELGGVVSFYGFNPLSNDHMPSVN